MIDTKILNFCLYLTPDIIHNEDLTKICYELLEKNKKSFNDQEYGHIINLNKIISMEFDEITLDGNTPVYIEANVDVVKPEKDMIIEVEIQKMIDFGIFAQNYDINFWISKENTDSYEFDPSINKYKNIDGNKLNIGDKIKIKINLIRYENKNYSCIGEFKDE